MMSSGAAPQYGHLSSSNEREQLAQVVIDGFHSSWSYWSGGAR